MKRLLPPPVRRYLRARHQALVFHRAMRAFLADPDRALSHGDPLVGDLVYGWGNGAWPPGPEYIAECLRHAAGTRGPILELGSGLTTLLVGTIARRRRIAVWSLEHLPRWGDATAAALRRYRIDGVHLCVAPLRDHGAFAWYDPPLDAMPHDFTLVVCDGPPEGTPGGRYGLAPTMGSRLAPGCVILLDDAVRAGEQAAVRRWTDELHADAEIRGGERPWVRLTLAGETPR